LGFLAKFTADQGDGLDLFKLENALGFKVAPFGAAPTLPAVHIQFSVVADGHLVHVDQAWLASFAGVFVINQLNDPVCFRGFAQRGLEFRLGLCCGCLAKDDQRCHCELAKFHCDLSFGPLAILAGYTKAVSCSSLME
jgi:hypothetical protein